MKHYGLMFHQSLVLFASCFGFGQEFEHDLELQLVSIDEEGERFWESVFLSKHRLSDDFFFRNKELDDICGGAFSPFEVEIEEVFGRVVRFSLIREPNRMYYVNLLFTAETSVQIFFREIRSRQRRECEMENTLDELFQYRIDDGPQNDEERIEKLADFPIYYTKRMSVEKDDQQTLDLGLVGSRTLNFTEHGPRHLTQNVYLVLLSHTFNISEKVGPNIYVLCSLNIVTHRFILVFNSSSIAHTFHTFIENHINHQIPCPNDWLLPEILEKMELL